MAEIAEFIARWSNSHGSERGNSQRFWTETVPSYEFEHSVAYKDDENKTQKQLRNTIDDMLPS